MPLSEEGFGAARAGQGGEFERLQRPRPAIRARSPCRRGPPVRPGRRRAGDLSLQARADPGRGLREPSQESPQALHSRACEILGDKPESAAAEPEAIAQNFTEAGLDDLAIEWWGKAGDQALRRSAFQEAIAHLGKAIAMADKTAGGESQTTPTRRLKLQADYRRAVMWSKGFAAEEQPSLAPAKSPQPRKTPLNALRATTVSGLGV